MSMFVSYCQYGVYTGDGGDGLPIYTVGDELLHVGGPAECTGFTGVHTGEIDIRIVVSEAEPPLMSDDDWDAASETTLWSADGRVTVLGLMAGPREGLTGVPLPRPGLARVRIYARNRIHESVRTDEDPPEQHEVHIWPATEEQGLRTLFDDGSRGPWPRRTAEAAVWAMEKLLAGPPAGPDADRVTVVRNITPPWAPPPAISAGNLEIRLEPAGDGYAFAWHPQASDSRPDDATGHVRIDGLTLRHENVAAHQAVLLGLIWDHLLESPPGREPAWEAPMRARIAAESRRAEERRRERAAREAAAWGGSPPTERLRGLRARARSLAELDRPLLDGLVALPPDRRRAVANWAARRALESAGLDRVGWIAEALATVEAGEPLPASLADDGFGRLLDDPRVPQTLLDTGGHTRILHQAVAFPALLALDEEDDLAAAVEALYIAAQASGARFRTFLADARAQL
ncbi:hypothetical protein [Actinoplanes sp. NPDC023714]|uniref:hypothetical protein n=1 Tax=Actinoplanes sp. NPDC023714 TaxID=3154322 RepID=UPI0033D45D8E